MTAPRERPRDFRLWIGPEPFDPREMEPPGGAPMPVQSWIVQFTATLTGPDRARLAAAYDLRLDQYVPNVAFLERLNEETVGRLREDFLVRACIPLDPAWKVSPDQPPPAQPTLVAALFPDADPDAVVAALGTHAAHDIEVIDDRPIGGSLAVRFALADPASLPMIAGLADVTWIEPLGVAVNFNVAAAQTIQSGTTPLSNPIWDRGLHGEGQVIGVIDDGTIDIDHVLFADGAPNKPGSGHRKVRAIHNQTDMGPTNHFMFVAAIAAGDDRTNPGTHPNRGGAWAAKLVCRNRGDMNQQGLGLTLLRMLTTSKDAGATIHNNSWGIRSTVYTQIAHNADKFSWSNEDHLVVAAGANTYDNDPNSPPGTAKNTLCVAAAKASPNHMSRGSGTSGPTLKDQRRKPEIMAVGCDIESALLDSSNTKTGAWPGQHPCGTSFATPHVSAAAALVRQYFREGWYPTGKKDKGAGITPSGALIKAVLLNSTVDMTGHQGYPSDAEGWGLIRLDRALYFDGGPRRLLVKDVRRKVGLAERETFRRPFYVSGTEELKITLVWTDPPPADAATQYPAVNQVLLMIQDPNNTWYLGNVFDVGAGVSTPNPNDSQDLVNNVQMVVVRDPPLGTWHVELRANVAAGERQGYALAISGNVTFLPSP